MRHLCLALLLLTAGCASSTPPDPAPAYQQSWPKSYTDTSCAEWAAQMTSEQRLAAAADMLTGARNKGDGGTGLPPAQLVESFRDDVSEGCSATGSSSVAEVGASIYMIGRDQYRP